MPPLRQILMIAFPGCQMLDVAGPLQMFAGVNDEIGSQVYGIRIASHDAGPLRTSSGLQVVADVSLREAAAGSGRKLDTLIVAGGHPGLQRELDNGKISQFLASQASGTRRIVSVCTGAFLLAAAGLLDGRRATTHWRAADALRRFRPAIKVDADPIHIRDGPIWTSAGVTAGIDLALELIEEDYGRQMALAVARRHVVFRIRPGGQSQFSPELAAQGGDDDRLRQLARRIAAEPGRDWRAGTLAQEAAMSLRSLTRRFRKEIGKSPAEFVELIRIDHARRALVETSAPIEVVACRSGFGSHRRMDRAFARVLAVTPTEFRERFKTNGELS
jgi:transcriptional regulator GlxA family with amidase domain